MQLTRAERWILANQYKILEHVDPENAGHYQMMQEVLEKGYETEYRWKTQHIYDDDSVVTEEKCHYVINVMAMYDALQQSSRRLADQEGIDANALAFPGFDGNNEGEYLGYAHFLRDKEGKFATLQLSGESLNSHFPTLDMYNRMLAAWAHYGGGHEMSRGDISAVLAVRIHPDNR